MTLVVFYFYVYKIKKYAKKANYPNEPAHYFLTLFRKRPKAESNTFYICASGCDFSTIQSAVDAANSGDIIIVKSGIYTESIKINKKDLTIKSESGAKETIIQRRAPNNYIFKIDATNVKINGFTIKGEGSHIVIDCIFLGQSRNAIISKNEIRNCYNGISIGENSDNITISRNNFIDNGIAINFKGNSYLSPHNTIYLNNFKNNEIDAYAYYLARRPIDNIFISRQKITYQFKGKTFLNYLGNYWDKYKGEDRNEDGILDDFYHFTSSYSKSFTDENPLVEPFENYSLIFEPPSISFSVENYNTGKKYSSIQEAIDDPETLNSHTILVGPRTYWENINLYKPLNIKSTSPNPEDAIIRSAHNPWQIIYLGAENITLSGFTIEGTISLENVEFNHILGNIFSGSLGEIRFSQVTSTIVANNKILNCNLSGVFLNGSYNLIISNEIINCREGISSNQGDYNIITRNNFINNNRAICFDYPFHTTVYLNNFKSSKETDVYIYYLSGERDNIFNSRQEIHYFYGGKEFSNYLGNYWDKFNATDMDGDGIGDEAYRFSFPYSKPVIDNYPLIEPIENYPDFQFKSWFFSDVFEYEGGKGFTSGIATLTGNKLKVEGKVSFHGSLPNSISQIRLIATNGIKDEIASKEIPLSFINFSQLKENEYQFSIGVENPPSLRNDKESHYEIYMKINDDSPFFINTNSKISPNYFSLSEIPLPEILIAEVYPNVAKDRGKEPENEWVIIYNTKNEELNISGWKICDEKSCDEIEGSIFPKGFAIITPEESTFEFWEIPEGMTKIILKDKTIGRGLNNKGDTLKILDQNGKEIDSITFGEVEKGKSLKRISLEIDTDRISDFKEVEPSLTPKIPKNKSPLSVINFFPKNPIKGIEVKFDASSSTDPDGEIINFEWQIKNASTSEILATSTGTTTNFTFNQNGEYEITLIATDNDGATSSTSTIIKVEPFSFAIITDLHIGRGYPDYNSSGFDDSGDGEDYYLTERLKNVVQWIIDNRNNIDCNGTKCPIKFLAVLGDISDSAEKSEFLKAKKILDKLNDYGIPYVPVFGNHDVWPYTNEEEATSTFGENYFDEIFWDENATNTKLIKEILGWQRDEVNKKFKNFIFNYGGINFIGLDFVKREKTARAEIHSPTEIWLKETLNKFQGKEPVILFSHHPLTEEKVRKLYEIPIVPFPFTNFTKDEIHVLSQIIQECENLVEGKQILGAFSGHVHGYYPQEIFEFKTPELNIFFDANYEYPSLSTVPVLTTEALMVASNRSDEYLKELKKKDEGMKGIIRIVKILSKNEIDYRTIEGKYDPETKQGEEFIGLNPYISRAYTIVPEKIYPCLFFKAHAFTEREVEFFWDFGDGTTSSQAWIPTKCYKEPKTYNVILKITDKNNLQVSELITRKIEIKKEPLVPKSIKLAKETWERAKVISKEFAEDLKEIIKKAGNIVLDFTDKLLFKLKVTHSEEIEAPIGSITIHFERAKEDIDLTNLKMDSNHHTKKVLFYMPEWPNEIEKSKILFIPK